MEAFYFRRGDYRRGLIAYYDASITGAEGAAPEQQAAVAPAQTRKNPNSKSSVPAPEPEPVDDEVIVVDQPEIHPEEPTE